MNKEVLSVFINYIFNSGYVFASGLSLLVSFIRYKFCRVINLNC